MIWSSTTIMREKDEEAVANYCSVREGSSRENVCTASELTPITHSQLQGPGQQIKSNQRLGDHDRLPTHNAQ
jgi:hypothetical protein